MFVGFCENTTVKITTASNKYTTPKVTTPGETTRKVTTQEVTTPEDTTPKVTTLEVTTPEDTTSEVTTTEVTTREVTTPEVTTTEVPTTEVTTTEVTTPECDYYGHCPNGTTITTTSITSKTTTDGITTTSKTDGECKEAKVIIFIEDNVNKIHGTVKFEQLSENDPLKVHGTLYGLPPGYHGFHIHEIGDTSNNCLASGSHFNPYNVRDFQSI